MIFEKDILNTCLVDNRYRTNINNLFIDIKNKIIVSTDGKILSIKPIKEIKVNSKLFIENDEIKENVLIPFDIIKEAKKIVGKRRYRNYQDYVQLYFCKDKYYSLRLFKKKYYIDLTFENKNDDKYPHIQNVLPKINDDDIYLTLNVDLLKRLTDSIGNDNQITMVIKKDQGNNAILCYNYKNIGVIMSMSQQEEYQKKQLLELYNQIIQLKN